MKISLLPFFKRIIVIPCKNIIIEILVSSVIPSPSLCKKSVNLFPFGGLLLVTFSETICQLYLTFGLRLSNTSSIIQCNLLLCLEKGTGYPENLTISIVRVSLSLSLPPSALSLSLLKFLFKNLKLTCEYEC